MSDPKEPIDLERKMADARRAERFRRENPELFKKAAPNGPAGKAQPSADPRPPAAETEAGDRSGTIERLRGDKGA